MIEAKVPKDIRVYETKLVGPLTGREVVCSALMLTSAIITYNICCNVFGMSLDMFICVANELKVSADVLLFDSLENTVSVSNHEFAAVLSDCSEYETRILLDIVRSAKKSMRENKRLIRGRHN